MTPINNGTICLVSLIFGTAGALLISIFGPRLGLVDFPTARSSHLIPTPKGGGIGILLAFIFSAITLHVPYVFWVSIMVVSIFSFIGDKVEISPIFRLLFQFAVAAYFVYSLTRQQYIQEKHYLVLLCALIFIVGTANFYNFMDGINGISVITGIVAFCLLGIFNFYYKSDNLIAVICLSFIFSCIGFLPFNMPKAQVFMGDVGSILLGFTFSGIAIYTSASLLDFICVSSFLLPFYIDEISSIYIRLKDRQSLFTPHRKHFYQFLANERHIPHWKISLGYGLIQFIIGLTIIFILPFGMGVIISLLAVYFLLFTSLVFLIRNKSVYN